MKFENPLANPYFILFSLLFFSVAGSAWTAKQLKPSPSKRDDANAVSMTSISNSQDSTSHHQITIPSSESWQGIGQWEAWHRYHSCVLPIAVGFFMLTLSGWSLLGVENLAMRPLN